MMRTFHRLVLALVLLLPHVSQAAAPPAPPRTSSGELQGARWRLDVPAGWNGELVMLAHGYEPVGVPQPSPMPANDSTAPRTAAPPAAVSAHSSGPSGNRPAAVSPPTVAATASAKAPCHTTAPAASLRRRAVGDVWRTSVMANREALLGRMGAA